MSTRRQFLRGMGYSLAIPLLPSLLPRNAAAAGATPPPRFLAMTGVNGMYPQDFFPTNFDATSQFNNTPDVRYRALSELNGGPISNVLGTMFNPVIGKMNIIRGLDGTTDNPGGHSNPPTTTPPALSGSFAGGFGFSVDAVMAASPFIYPTAPALGALRVSPHLRPDFNWSYCYDSGNNLSAYASDAAVFQLLFANLVIPSGDGGTPQPPDPALLRRKKVVDVVLQDYSKLVSSPKLSTADKQKLTNYFDLLTDVQGRLTASISMAMQPQQQPTVNVCQKPNINAAADIVTAYRNHMDMIVAAFACGLTRVAVMHIPHYLDDADAVAGSGGPPGSHHSESHNVNSVPDDGLFLQFSQWQASRVAEMLTKLDAFMDSDGNTLLDNSLVLWTNEMAEGKLHSLISMPVVTAGGAGGQIRTGNYIDYRQSPTLTINADGYGYSMDIGRPYNELLVTTLAAMGMQPQDYERNGVQGFGDYVDEGGYYGGYFNAGKRNPLPFLKT